MSTEPAPQSGQRAPGWITAASVSMAVAAWLALVLHYQYQVAWLGDYVVASDAVFLAGVAGTALTWSVERRGVARLRPVAVRLVFSIAVFAGALIVAEFAARFVFRRAISTVGPHVRQLSVRLPTRSSEDDLR